MWSKTIYLKAKPNYQGYCRQPTCSLTVGVKTYVLQPDTFHVCICFWLNCFGYVMWMCIFMPPLKKKGAYCFAGFLVCRSPSLCEMDDSRALYLTSFKLDRCIVLDMKLILIDIQGNRSNMKSILCMVLLIDWTSLSCSGIQTYDLRMIDWEQWSFPPQRQRFWFSVCVSGLLSICLSDSVYL